MKRNLIVCLLCLFLSAFALNTAQAGKPEKQQMQIRIDSVNITDASGEGSIIFERYEPIYATVTFTVGANTTLPATAVADLTAFAQTSLETRLITKAGTYDFTTVFTYTDTEPGTKQIAFKLKLNNSKRNETATREVVIIGESNELIPVLRFPLHAALMDNNCYDWNDIVSWYFEWSPVPGASEYHLYVISQKDCLAMQPLVDDALTTTSYYFESTGWVGYSDPWGWKVRAKVDGVWQEWSKIRLFFAEPVDTDCSY